MSGTSAATGTGTGAGAGGTGTAPTGFLTDTAGGGTGGGTGTADPRTWLPEAYRADPTFADLKDVDGLAKSYKHAASLVGVDRAQVLRLPKDEAAAEWADVYARLGCPEKPDGYELKGPEGLAPEVLTEFGKTLHTAGLSKRQAAAVMDFYSGQVTAQATALQQAQDAMLAQTTTTLKQEWGQAFDDHAHAARRAVRELGGDALAQKLQQAGLANDLDVVRMFAKVGMERAEAAGLKSGGGGGFNVNTPAAAQAEIRRLQGDRDFGKVLTNRSDPGHAEAKRRWDALHGAAYAAVDGG